MTGLGDIGEAVKQMAANAKATDRLAAAIERLAEATERSNELAEGASDD